MRFYEFNNNMQEGFLDAVKNIFNSGSSTPLSSLTVPTSTRGPDVADLQKVLVALGFPLPKFGIDGIRANETNRAIGQFQKSVGLPASGEPDAATIEKLNAVLKTKPDIAGKLTKSTETEIAKQTSDKQRASAPKVAELPSNEEMAAAKQVAEQYLGKGISDQEWNYLLRATAGEASSNPTEQAYVMGVILNRVRSGQWGNDIISVLTAKNQFQAVTGTRVNPGASRTFNNPGSRLGSIVKSTINILPNVPNNLMYFTAADPRAYGPGTNIGFRSKLMAKKGSVVIGGTVFA